MPDWTHPSDSGEESHASGVTVDTITVRFPATTTLLELLPIARVDRLVDDDTGEIYDRTSGGEYGQQVGLEVVKLYASSRSGSPRARVTFSAPKLLHQHNAVGAALSLIPDCVDAVLSELGTELSDIPSWRDVEVVRLDLVRDFTGLTDVRGTLQSLAELHVPRVRRHARDYAEDDGRLVYVRKGFARSWKVRCYDKEHQLREVAQRHPATRSLYLTCAEVSEGLLRYENELTRDLIHRKGLSTVAALEDEKALVDLAKHHFDLSNLGAVTGSGRPLRGLLADLRASKRNADARNLLVYLSSQALGEPAMLSRHALDRARALARRHQLTGDVFTDAAQPRRLDFESGTELVGDDALRHPVGDEDTAAG